MIARMLINGIAGDRVSAADRGFSYGDGLFETIRFVGDAAPLWSRHMQRMADGCQRLRLPAPDAAQLLKEARDVTRDMPHAVVRITLSRGVGTRGYAPPSSPQITRVVAAFDPPLMHVAAYADGIRMRLCDTRMAEQPLLAGIKHLNRLEQVLARAEWNDPSIADGLMCDTHGRVICATMANLFAVIDGELVTPALDQCGVAGVGRAEILAVCPQACETELRLDRLKFASEVFLSSSVRGILPVCALGDWRYLPGDTTRQLQQHWRNLGFSMEHGG
jgi:4-amino-4-deoxychorismate lyase